MTDLHDEKRSALAHCVAMYRQLHSIYPKEHQHLQRQIEALIQLGDLDTAEALLDQLQALMQSSHSKHTVQSIEDIRQYINQTKRTHHYYSTPFLHLASPKGLKRFLHQHSKKTCKEGEYLMRFGDTDQQMYIVLSGEFAVWSQDEQGNKHFEHMLGAGEIIGELAFLDNTPRNADVIACSDACVLAIPAESVYKLFLEDPKIELALRQEADIRKRLVSMKVHKALAKLPHHQQRLLAKEAKLMHTPALTRIYQSGEPITSIDLICKGKINFITEQGDGSSLMLHVLHRGDLIGCSAATPHMERQHSADIVAMDDVTRMVFPLAYIQKLCELNAGFYQALLHIAVEERSHLAQHLPKQA